MGQSHMGNKNLFIMIRNLVLLRGKRQGIEEIQAPDIARCKILERIPLTWKIGWKRKA